MFKKWAVLVVLVFVTAACRSSKHLFKKGSVSQTEVFDVKIPFEVNSNLLIVTLEIEGQPYRFLFDTGAPMVVDKALRQKFDMKKVARKRVGDSQGKAKNLDYVKMPPFKLGELTASGLVAIEADLKSTPSIYCLNLDGIIGANFMRLGFWEIDVLDSLMRFTNDFSRIAVDSSAAELPFKIQSSGTPIVSAKVNDSLIPYITFDTGSAGIMDVPARRVNVDFKDSLSVQSIGFHSAGLFGSKLDTAYKRLLPIILGQDSLAALALDVEDPGAKSLLGMGYLKNYRMVLNWENQKIYLLRKKDFEPSSVKRFGLSPFLKDSTMVVGVITPTFMQAQNASAITLGDTILEINALKVSEATADVYCEVLNAIRASDTMNISIKDKGNFSIRKQPLFTD